MATLEGWLLLAWFSTILYVVYGSMHNHDEVEANNFEVKPGAGRQNFVRQWVCYIEQFSPFHVLQNKPYRFPVKDLYPDFNTSAITELMILAVNRRFFPNGPKIASDQSAFLYGLW